MLSPRWTYSSDRRLTQWYGHLDYYGPYIIGQWFVLDAETGKQYWARRFRRPNTVRGVFQDVIIASETRSDGPWTVDYGIYGINVKNGTLLWTNHGRGFCDTLCRCLDYVPGFTNEIRDSPDCIVGEYLLTRRGRVLAIRTGQEVKSVTLDPDPEPRSPAQEFYDKKSLPLENGDTLAVNGFRDELSIVRTGRNGREQWRFLARDRSAYVRGDYYSYRLVGNRIYIILGDAPECVPINPAKPLFVQPNPANYQLGIIDMASGECHTFPLVQAAHRTECRIEAFRHSRMLVSCDGTVLTEYEIAIS